MNAPAAPDLAGRDTSAPEPTDHEPADAESDDMLARAAAVGDRDAFEELVRRTLPMLLRYANRMTPDRGKAEEVVQETLLAAWRGLPKFAFQSSFRTWAFSIAHRKIIDLRRKQTELLAEDDMLAAVPSGRPTPAQESMAGSLLEALEQELAQLPHVARAVWWLREMEGMSHPEIAAALQISPGSVRGNLQRTRARLAERMQPWRPGGNGSGHGPSEDDDDPTEDASATGPTTRGATPKRRIQGNPGLAVDNTESRAGPRRTGHANSGSSRTHLKT
ncbi:RNA polymerase sigma factor [Williamsia sp. CHRR-6]|uniref:RNA polymerase sigma factor n=1 Tax=Williamsia sp. CHRR-6 TaxID=2835871 RepID=UPI001BDA8545|nr:sigma-70 family RNA polymerase sigma factor [Williamsia sp. CHRR-6]MBT0567307.1 sigma-70 family RNA polymerase sigma factor [Williamsia sp. CHRR-6]